MGLPRRSTAALIGLTLGLACLVAGCAGHVEGPSLVLTLVSPDPPSEPNGPAIQHFAQEVARRSSGTIRIHPVWDLTKEGVDDWDQVVATAVADGTYDLGLVPSRAWDVLGVTSLRALNTPFLIGSDAAMRAVLASEVRSDLLAGLSSAGVEGIDLWPSEMRRFFGIGEPLVRPADFLGEQIRSPTSRTVTALLQELGAKVVQTERGAPGQRGLESSFATVDIDAVATGNVVPFPKVETLVANDELRSRLQPGQWQVLVDAAAATRRNQLASFPTDDDSVRDFCNKGGRIVAATPLDLADFEKAGQEVRTELEQDPGTATLIDSIESVVATMPPAEPVTACPKRDAGSKGRDDGTQALDGIYVARVTRHDMVTAGVTDPVDILNNTGRYTWTLEDGHWHYTWRAKHFVPEPERDGQYGYKNGRLTFSWDATEAITARLVIDRDGTIHFQDLHDNVASLQKATEGFFSGPWRRVGDLPD